MTISTCDDLHAILPCPRNRQAAYPLAPDRRKADRRALLAGLVLAALGPSPALADATWLVTEAEMAASRAAAAQGSPLVARSSPQPDAPRIDLILPDVARAVPSPTSIRLRFEPKPPAAIRADSFRVRYGSLGLDITSRVTGSASVTPNGIDVPEARLPKGSHRLTVEIRDSLGRIAERRIEFTVE